MESVLGLKEFRENASGGIILDVRSPGEFEKGHIPDAISFPLFSDEERALVGTTYKQVSKESAILEGLRIVGPRLAQMVETARDRSGGKDIFMYCWRGGMRSGSVAWLLRTAGFRVYTLRGGYKAYRTDVLETINTPRMYRILTGRTGSGKTDILNKLQTKGLQVIDMEGLARHRGSAFGTLHHAPQPSIESFENTLSDLLKQMDTTQPIWIEDESKNIGKVFLQYPFWQQMQCAPVVVIRRSRPFRCQYLAELYADSPVEYLQTALDTISKRLGGAAYQEAVQALKEKRYATVADICLNYYDKSYDHLLAKRNPHILCVIESDDEELILHKITELNIS